MAASRLFGHAQVPVGVALTVGGSFTLQESQCDKCSCEQMAEDDVVMCYDA